MSSNTEAAASQTQASLGLIYFGMVGLFLVTVLFFLSPILRTIQRIEANQQKCQEQGK